MGTQRDLCHGEKTGKGDRHLDATSRDNGVGATIQLKHEVQIEGSRVSICSRIPQHASYSERRGCCHVRRLVHFPCSQPKSEKM